MKKAPEDRGGTHVDEERICELESFVEHAEGEHGIPCGDVLRISGHGAEALDGGGDVSICRELLELQSEVIWAKKTGRAGRVWFGCKDADKTEETRCVSGEHQRTVGSSRYNNAQAISVYCILMSSITPLRLVQSQIHPSGR